MAVPKMHIRIRRDQKSKFPKPKLGQQQQQKPSCRFVRCYSFTLRAAMIRFKLPLWRMPRRSIGAGCAKPPPLLLLLLLPPLAAAAVAAASAAAAAPLPAAAAAPPPAGQRRLLAGSVSFEGCSSELFLLPY
jgi:hypothetical protein